MTQAMMLRDSRASLSISMIKIVTIDPKRGKPSQRQN
jgi:hypothetical protein